MPWSTASRRPRPCCLPRYRKGKEVGNVFLHAAGKGILPQYVPPGPAYHFAESGDHLPGAGGHLHGGDAGGGAAGRGHQRQHPHLCGPASHLWGAERLHSAHQPVLGPPGRGGHQPGAGGGDLCGGGVEHSLRPGPVLRFRAVHGPLLQRRGGGRLRRSIRAHCGLFLRLQLRDPGVYCRPAVHGQPRAGAGGAVHLHVRQHLFELGVHLRQSGRPALGWRGRPWPPFAPGSSSLWSP